MPVNWVRVEMPLGGVNTISDPVHVLPGKMLTVQNGRFDQPGGISKRKGYTLRSGNIFNDAPLTLTTGIRLAEMTDGEQLLFDTRHVYAWEEHSSNQAWVDRGRPGDTLIESELVNFDQASNLGHCDIAVAPNGMRLVCWGFVLDSDDDGIADSEHPVFDYFVSINDTILVKGATAPLGTSFQLIEPFVIGTEIWALNPSSTAPAGANILVGFIDSIDDDPGELTFAPAAFPAPTIGTQYWDLTKAVASLSAAQRFAVLYSDGGDADQLHVTYRNSTTIAQVWNHDSGIAATEIYCTALLSHGGFVWVAYGVGNDIRMYLINETTGVTATADSSIDATGEDIVRIAMCPFGASTILLTWEQKKGDAATPPSNRLPFVRWCIVDTTLNDVGDFHICSDVAIIGKPYAYDGLFYLPVMHTGEGYGNGFIIQIADALQTTDAQGPSWRATFARDVCTADGLDIENEAVQISLIDVPGRGHVPNVVQNSIFGDRVFPIRSAERFEAAKVNDDAIIIRHCGVRLVTVFTQASARNWAQWGQGMFITSGRPSWYDGAQISEHGFAWQPSVDRDTPGDLAVVAGGFPINTQIQAQLVFQFQDVNGQIQQSEPSAVMEAETTAINQGFEVNLINTILTDRAAPDTAYWSTGVSRARFMTYRTTGETGAPGPVFYRTDSVYSGNEIFPNELTSSTVQPEIDFQIVVDDANLIDNEVLYTTGGILPNTGTPPAEVCHVHGGRLWLAQLEDLHDVWFSQPFVAAEAPRFNGNLKLRFPDPVFSLGTLDDKLIVGCQRSLYVVTGNGPPAAGDIDIGFQVEQIASDVGCFDHRSMVSTPMGLMFFSSRGFMLIDRSMQLQEIGAPVRGLLFANSPPLENGLFPAFSPIRCGTLVADQSQVRWLSNYTDDADNIHAVWFVYDYRVGEWSIDYTGNVGFAEDSIAFNNGADYAYLTLLGQVFDEDLTVAEDAGEFYEFQLETPWIRLDTIQGWQRFRSVTILGRRPTDPCNLVVAIGYDYEDSYSAAFVVTDAQIAALPTDVLQFKFRSPKQKCESFRILIADAQDEGVPGDNSGLRISSLVFECGLKRGTMKLRAEQKA